MRTLLRRAPYANPSSHVQRRVRSGLGKLKNLGSLYARFHGRGAAAELGLPRAAWATDSFLGGLPGHPLAQMGLPRANFSVLSGPGELQLETKLCRKSNAPARRSGLLARLSSRQASGGRCRAVSGKEFA